MGGGLLATRATVGGRYMTNRFSHKQRRMLAYSIPVLAVLAALLFGAIMLLLLGANPVEGYVEMFVGAFGSGDALIATTLKATPLLFVGVGIVIAFRANVINIGAEGQMVLGGLFTAIAALYLPDMPAFLMVPAVLIAGIIGGALWGWIPGALKAYYRVNEILSTIMLNIVAVQLMSYLLRGPLIDPADIEPGTRKHYNGDLAELIVYDRVLDATELGQVTDYLATKYAIPEPSSIVLAGFALIGLLVGARRRRTR